MFVNNALIDFAVLLQVDLQYLNEILRDGADPNSADKYGQTTLHEVRWSATEHQMVYRRYSHGIWNLFTSKYFTVSSGCVNEITSRIHFLYKKNYIHL